MNSDKVDTSVHFLLEEMERYDSFPFTENRWTR